MMRWLADPLGSSGQQQQQQQQQQNDDGTSPQQRGNGSGTSDNAAASPDDATTGTTQQQQQQQQQSSDGRVVDDGGDDAVPPGGSHTSSSLSSDRAGAAADDDDPGGGGSGGGGGGDQAASSSGALTASAAGAAAAVSASASADEMMMMTMSASDAGGDTTDDGDDSSSCDDNDDTADHVPSLGKKKKTKQAASATAAAAGGGAQGTGNTAADTAKDANANNAKKRKKGGSDDDGDDHADETQQLPDIVWKPQNVQSSCEFTHTITGYASKRESGCKKAEYSSTTVDDLGNRWRLIVYVNGNGRASNHHLSLFLQVADAEDLPFGWKKTVSYVLTLEHPKGGTLSYAKRNPDKTFKLCPKAIDWGWSQFITSDRIQQEAFVEADSLTVRAAVTVKSSSVSIDEEDSELYLKCAVEEGDADAVQLCLDQGASVNCKFKDDLYTPLHTACSSGTSSGSMEVLELLLENGADCNACNKWRETPLLIAANNGHCEAVKGLLRHGADSSLCSEAGWSALTFAAHKGFHDIVDVLLQANAPVDCKVTEDSSTPLHKACAGSKDGHLPCVKLLLAGRADVHALNKWRETPLLTAANHGQSGAVEALIGAGADPCRCTDTGWSPLSIAAYKGHDEVVRLLLEDGAPTEEDDTTLSALLQAATKGLPDTVQLLLRHGADHTVTTKKGDTALSILVEQNLIDAAVEMVTVYSASIPRCSRDRKKVQRARLLINLRMKQMERDGKTNLGRSDDDDETDGDGPDEAIPALHEEGSGDAPPQSTKKQQKKKKKRSSSAEEKAKAAEEALLMELEEEDEKARKEKAEANKKRAKNRKKKDREKQQKLKEEQERLEREEKQAKEEDRSRKEKEEKERKKREQKLKEEREREAQEMKEREKVLAAKRKERDGRLQKERDQKQRGKGAQKREDVATPAPAAASGSPEKRNKAQKTQKGVPPGSAPAAVPVTRAATVGATPATAKTPPVNTKSNVTAKTSPAASKNGAGASQPASNRRWETNAKTAQTPQPASQLTVQTSVVDQNPAISRSSSHPELSCTDSSPPRNVSPKTTGQIEADNSQFHFEKKEEAPNPSNGQTPSFNGVHSQMAVASLEHPAMALFRRDKMSELLQQCKASINGVDETTLRKSISRWIIRAAHGQIPSADPMIPSGPEVNQVAAFFQRQFISESRRGSRQQTSIEALRSAGSSVAVLCRNVANELVAFRRSLDALLPAEWTDADLGMTATEEVVDGNGSIINVSWANRASVYIPAYTFASLRDRHHGPATRFLAAMFVTKVWYDTKRIVGVGSVMDFRVPPSVQACLSADAAVSAELWSDPLQASSKSVFWGNFEEVDTLFGGQKPFGKYEQGGEDVLALHGGSVSVVLPFDPMVASRYVKRLFDIFDAASPGGVPVSCVMIAHEECFHECPQPEGPSPADLRLLDPRFGEMDRNYVRAVELLPAGQHVYHSGEGIGKSQVCTTNSLLIIIQTEAAKTRFNLADASVARIVESMTVNVPSPVADSGVSPAGISTDFASRESPLSPQNGFFEGLTPISTQAQAQQETIPSGFGAVGGATIIQSFSPANNDAAARASRPGRLFDLVDDGADEDHLNSVDLVSGMLNNLDVGLFQSNAPSDVDIEAISLMGINGPSPRGGGVSGESTTTTTPR